MFPVLKKARWKNCGAHWIHNLQIKKTPPIATSLAIGGYLCSILVSNIFSNPHFPSQSFIKINRFFIRTADFLERILFVAAQATHIHSNNSHTLTLATGSQPFSFQAPYLYIGPYLLWKFAEPYLPAHWTVPP